MQHASIRVLRTSREIIYQGSPGRGCHRSIFLLRLLHLVKCETLTTHLEDDYRQLDDHPFARVWFGKVEKQFCRLHQ
jgi:hypothetical protein